jgi:hypothetical protein
MLAAVSNSLSAMLRTLLIVYVAVGFLVAAIRVQRRRSRMQPLVEAAGLEPVLFRTHIQVKLGYRWGWGPKTLGAMQLTIGVATLQVTTRPGIAGRVLGSEWFFSARDTQIRRSKLRTDPLRREWIIFSGAVGGPTKAIAVKPLGSSLEEVWEALLRAGCQPF